MNGNLSKFNHAFNELQNVIANKINQSTDTNFGSLLKAAQVRNDKVILTYIDKLNFYREFRNLLTHKTFNSEEAIAIPSISLIEDIKEITEKIKHPKKVKDLFLNEVVTFNQEDKLSSVLEVVKARRYSQFPVFNSNQLIGIISENGITNFLANSIDDDLISIKETSIKNILDADEEKDLYEVITENKSIFDIESIFNKRVNEGKTAYLLLISKGNSILSGDDVVGIITPWDIPTIIENK